MPAGLTIDGTTQTGFAGDPVVALDGSALAGDLLAVTGAGTTVQSLSLHSAGGVRRGGHRPTTRRSPTPGSACCPTAATTAGVGGDGIGITGATGALVDAATVTGSGGDGIRVDGAVAVRIDGGRITANAGNGISVVGATADGVAVVDTLVCHNDGLGIDLGDDGVTANDVGDIDTGPNGLFNRPVVTSVSASGGTVTMDVTLDVLAGDVLLQVLTTPHPDPAGAGEGDALVHARR